VAPGAGCYAIAWANKLDTVYCAVRRELEQGARMLTVGDQQGMPLFTLPATQ
jgi:hypothetical protein